MHDPNGKCIGVEVSRKSFVAACVDAEGNAATSTTESVDPTRSIVEQLAGFIAGLVGTYGQVDGVGIGLPALIDRDGGRVAYSAHIAEFSGIDLAQAISSATGIPAFIENDANAAAFGEFRLGAGRGCSTCFYATLGVGVGGALILDGEIWRGASGFAGEFGFLPIDAEGTRLEDVASSANIIRRVRSRVQQDSTSSLGEIDLNELAISDVVRAAAAGDDFSKLMLQRTGIHVGAAVAAVINLLTPERIIIGGEIMQARSIVLDSILKKAKELSFGPSFAATEIVEGSLGANAGCIGAALLANRVFAQRSGSPTA